MEFKIQQREHPNIKNYGKDEFSLAKRFSEDIRRELGDFLKAVVLFGSSARHDKSFQIGDIDVLLVVNDLTMVLSPEVVEAYRVIVENTAAKISKRFHITTLKLTAFWEYVRNGDPIAINMLRDGMPLYDAGFFEPVQMLLFQGRIRPTKESIWGYFTRAPITMNNSQWHILQATLDLYWACADACHAALMTIGETPPTPSHLALTLRNTLVKAGHASKKSADTMEAMYKLSKDIAHRQVQRITGKQYEEYKKMVEDFIREMKKVVEGRGRQ